MNITYIDKFRKTLMISLMKSIRKLRVITDEDCCPKLAFNKSGSRQNIES